ncbi:MAG: type II secretion system protein M [Myxococcales bacterium]|nr:type II secretion system protein M [Myxococcales bacterium]
MAKLGDIKTKLARPLAAVAGEWDRMAPRERRLVAALGAAVVLMVMFVGGFMFFSSLGDVETRNEEIRDALKAIARNRNEYLEAKGQMRALEVRIGSIPPQLATDLEAAAREVGIQIPETNERPAAAVGKRYMEHNVDVTLRQVDLQQLARFLHKLETGQHMIYVTRLDVRRRFAEKDKLDVKLTASGIERVQAQPNKRKLAGGRPEDV